MASTVLYVFGGIKKYFKKKSCHGSTLTISGRNKKNFDFSSCATSGSKLVEIPS